MKNYTFKRSMTSQREPGFEPIPTALPTGIFTDLTNPVGITRKAQKIMLDVTGFLTHSRHTPSTLEQAPHTSMPVGWIPDMCPDTCCMCSDTCQQQNSAQRLSKWDRYQACGKHMLPVNLYRITIVPYVCTVFYCLTM